jgi:hypothetical protein
MWSLPDIKRLNDKAVEDCNIQFEDEENNLWNYGFSIRKDELCYFLPFKGA